MAASQRRARELMGAHYFGVEEAVRHFGVSPTSKQLVALSVVPFTEATLGECKDTHLLVAVFPMSILEMRRLQPTLFYSHDWYNRQPFASDSGEVGWQLVRTTSASGCADLTWDEQLAMLSEHEEPPAPRTMVYAIIGHFLATGEHLFERDSVRCTTGDYRVFVGYFNVRGLDIHTIVDGYRNGYFGIASARKHE